MKKWILFLALPLCFFMESQAQITIASDNALNGNFETNGNGGFGFGNWNISKKDNSGTYIGQTGLDTSTTGTTYGIWSNGGELVATRHFERPLDIYQSFSVEFGHTGIDDNGEIGISLYSGEDFRFNFKFVGGTNKYMLNNGGSDFGTGISYSGEKKITFKFTRLEGNHYNIYISVDGGGSFDGTDHTASSGEMAITRVVFYSKNQGNNQNVGFDHLKIEGGSTRLTGSEGWRLLSSPAQNQTFNNLIGNFWSQGIATGAKVSNGSPNVLVYDGSAFVAPADLGATLNDGQGFAFYAYDDDDYDGVGNGFPKNINLTGDENTGDVSVSLNIAGDSVWTLAGNPFASSIKWNDITKTGLSDVVYVYDYTIPAYISYNGTAGGLTDGIIAPFQGFFVHSDGQESSFTIPQSAKSSSGHLYKSAPAQSLKLMAEMGELTSQAYFTFTENGSIGMDRKDAYKLAPLDFKDYLSLSTISDGISLDINNLPESITDAISIPLQVQAFHSEGDSYLPSGGSVVLNWENLSSLPSDWSVFLVDHFKNESINMRNQQSYSFDMQAPNAKAVAYERNLTPQLMAAGDARFSIELGPKATAISENEVLPNSIRLLQNYPNPFNPNTQISFEVPKTMQVSLKVYDMLGREVATLLNGSVAGGLHQINFNAAQLGSGMYIYRLQAGAFSFSKRMTLIK